MPAEMDKLVKHVKKQNPKYDDSKAWATAWSIYCTKHPGSEHCKQKKYFGKKKKKAGSHEWISVVASETVGLLKEE